MESEAIIALSPIARIELLKRTGEKVDSLPKSEATLSQMKGSPYSPTYLNCQVVLSKKTISVLFKNVALIMASLVGASINPPFPNWSERHASAATGLPN